MNAVVELNESVNRNTRIIENLGEYTAGNFHVKSTPVRYRDSDGVTFSAPDKKVLYRTDTGDCLNVVGRRYKIAQYKDTWKAAERILINSELDLTGLARSMEQSHNGGRAYAIYTLPAYTIETGKGDATALQVLAYSSFDGSWSFSLETGYVRMICTNRQVSVVGFSIYKSKHTPRLDIDLGVTKIGGILQNYEEEQERWKRWRRISVSDREAFDTFAVAAKCKFPKARPDLTINKLLEEPEVYRNTALNYMWEQYSTVERRALGGNEWAVFNAMTHWSTHADAARKSSQNNISSIKVRRGELVRHAALKRLAA